MEKLLVYMEKNYWYSWEKILIDLKDFERLFKYVHDCKRELSKRNVIKQIIKRYSCMLDKLRHNAKQKSLKNILLKILHHVKGKNLRDVC